MAESPRTVKVSHFSPTAANPQAAEREERAGEAGVPPGVPLFVGGVEQGASVSVRERKNNTAGRQKIKKKKVEKNQNTKRSSLRSLCPTTFALPASMPPACCITEFAAPRVFPLSLQLEEGAVI